MITSFGHNWLIFYYYTDIYHQCVIKHIITLPITTITSVLKVLTYIITSITSRLHQTRCYTSDHFCLNLHSCSYSICTYFLLIQISTNVSKSNSYKTRHGLITWDLNWNCIKSRKSTPLSTNSNKNSSSANCCLLILVKFCLLHRYQCNTEIFK